ncbi:DNA uptake protein ComE-like DNA-binding protein [Sinomonas atrocyanea]|uniref:ComEA family DNA-binding protein n=1 Tax=Sinomonas atrocyanea TaxID=37927 RepID=UPI002787F99C|nr:helix-hairpin-helix domain-containing protein [Sinomonas atrocyanea]MDP9883104.1 DNA uptake protein ComE-like DNA-binding protein [Sinomonas atrocyanea]
MTPEEKLCSRWWRIRNSAGVLWPILTAGVLGCVVFLFRGIKSKTTSWIIMGAVFGLIDLGIMVGMQFVDMGTKSNPAKTPAASVMSTVVFVNWVASMVMAFVINKKWLLWKARHGQPWYAGTPAAPAVRTTSAVNAGGLAKAFDTPTVSGGPAPVEVGRPGPVDVNVASSGDLQRLGLDAPTADRIILTRDQNQGFPNFEQMVAAVGVPPHQLLAVREQLAFGARPAASEPSRRLFD